MCCECNEWKVIKIASIIFLVITIIVLLILCINSKNPQSNPNILVAIARNGDNTTVGTTSIRFSQNNIIEGNAISHTEGSDEIQINETGIYQVSYQLYGVQNVTGTFNFNAILSVNNEPLQDTFNESPVIRNSTSNRMTLTSTVILRLQTGDILKLNGVSIEDIVYENARIDIEKIE